MSTLSLVLAQAGETDKLSGAGANPLAGFNQALRDHPDLLNRPEHYTPLLADMPLLWALVFVIVGALCVVYGYRSHKIVITVIAALAGVWAGLSMGETLGDPTITAVCAALLFGVLSWPLLKFQVALFGGLCGAFAGANLFTTIGLAMEKSNTQIPGGVEAIKNSPYLGAFVGLVVIGMMAFLAFRAVVILFTTILGATLLVSGGLAALMSHDAWATSLQEGMNSKPLMVPVVVTVISVIGTTVQLSGGVGGLKTIADRADPKAKKGAPAKA